MVILQCVAGYVRTVGTFMTEILTVSEHLENLASLNTILRSQVEVCILSNKKGALYVHNAPLPGSDTRKRSAINGA